MILEQETFDKYGYNPKNLARCSNKFVIGICDFCKKQFEKQFSSINYGHQIINKDVCQNIKCRTEKCRESNKTKYPNGIKRTTFNNFEKKPLQIGEKYGFLEVIENPIWTKKGKSKVVRQFVKCKCVCNSIKEYRANNLTSQKTKSCGCKSNNLKSKHLTTHGESGTRLYKSWAGMISRCQAKFYDKSSYREYNIQVCSEWKDDFLNFKKWALKHNYSDELVLDRIDPYKNYCPENCQFITPKENGKRVTQWRDEQIKSLKLQILSLEKENAILKNINYTE